MQPASSIKTSARLLNSHVDESRWCVKLRFSHVCIRFFLRVAQSSFPQILSAQPMRELAVPRIVAVIQITREIAKPTYMGCSSVAAERLRNSCREFIRQTSGLCYDIGHLLSAFDKPANCVYDQVDKTTNNPTPYSSSAIRSAPSDLHVTSSLV